ncbi:MAG: hypothetical protein LUH15_04055 [Tannerellaceae bacterium]|nr:hypothetical protein [Tannerellaceae bacterium]
MLTTLLITLIILVVCVSLLSIKIICKKNGTFPNLHIGGNIVLAAKGISCAKTQDRERLSHKTLEERLKEIEI